MEFSGSRAISDTLEVLKQRIGPLAGLWAVFLVIQVVVGIVFGIITAVLGMSGSSNGLAAGSMLISLLSNLANFYVSSASSAALTTTASPITKSPFSDALGIGFRAAPWLLLFYLVIGLGFLAVGLVLALVAFGIGAIAGQTAAILLALVIGLPVLVYVGTKLSMVPPIVAVDGVRNPIEAIGKSWRMTDGAALKIFLVQMAFGAAVLVLMLVFFAPMIGSIVSASSAGEMPDFSAMAGSIGLALVGVLVLVLVLPVISAALIAAMHAQLSSGGGGRISETFA